VKRALVTGASRGIGAALAHALHAGGVEVVQVARGAMDPGLGPTICADLSDLSEAERVLEVAGDIDLLVNNAGIETVTATALFDAEAMERMLVLNLHTPVRLIRRVLPRMLARGHGSIVDICSVAARVHPPYQSLYSATKAGLAAHGRSLRAELRGSGVHHLSVFPGPVRTDLGVAAANATTAPAHLLPWGTPEQLATRVVDAIGQRRSIVVYPRFYWLAMLFPGIAQFLTDLQRAQLRAPRTP
jgi:short-subunit dehydrogenase